MSSHLDVSSHAVIAEQLVKRVKDTTTHMQSVVQEGSISLDDVNILLDNEPHYVAYCVLWFESVSHFKLFEGCIDEEEYQHQLVDCTGGSTEPILAFIYSIRNQELDLITWNLAQDRCLVVLRPATPSAIKKYTAWWIEAYIKDMTNSYTLALNETRTQSVQLTAHPLRHKWFSDTAKYIWAESYDAEYAFKTLDQFLEHLDARSLIVTLTDTFSTAHRPRYNLNEEARSAIIDSIFSLSGCFIDLLPGKEEPRISIPIPSTLDDTVDIDIPE